MWVGLELGPKEILSMSLCPLAGLNDRVVQLGLDSTGRDLVKKEF